ncbi:hypothetical protein F4780DRAFT_305606 [Xylariomycetidae sp. FL0641]|nr:hypothetical protein F4780DRAFT_305606 [Xylariomycetidae sp. FL0641]
MDSRRGPCSVLEVFLQPSHHQRPRGWDIDDEVEPWPWLAPRLRRDIHQVSHGRSSDSPVSTANLSLTYCEYWDRTLRGELALPESCCALLLRHFIDLYAAVGLRWDCPESRHCETGKQSNKILLASYNGFVRVKSPPDHCYQTALSLYHLARPPGSPFRMVFSIKNIISTNLYMGTPYSCIATPPEFPETFGMMDSIYYKRFESALSLQRCRLTQLSDGSSALQHDWRVISPLSKAFPSSLALGTQSSGANHEPPSHHGFRLPETPGQYSPSGTSTGQTERKRQATVAQHSPYTIRPWSQIQPASPNGKWRLGSQWCLRLCKQGQLLHGWPVL